MTRTWLYAPMTAELEAIFPRVKLEDLEELLRRHGYVPDKANSGPHMHAWERSSHGGRMTWNVDCPVHSDWDDFIRLVKHLLESMAATAWELDAKTGDFHVDLLRELGQICDRREHGSPAWVSSEPCEICGTVGTRVVRVGVFERNVGKHKRGEPITKLLCLSCEDAS